MSIIALAAVALLSGPTGSQTQGQTQAQAQAAPPRSSSTVTRDLNSAPPAAAGTTAAPAQATAAPTTGLAPIGAVPAAQPRPAATTPTTRSPAASTLPPIGQTAPAPATQSAPPQAAPVQTTPGASTPPTAPAALSPAAIAALPFRIELPADATMTASRAGSDANVYAVRRGDQVLVMIYAGPSSQFPIFDGEMVRAGGRASVVVPEGGRRLAMEHLFQRATAPREIHVWVASPGGADRDLAERIGQSVDVR